VPNDPISKWQNIVTHTQGDGSGLVGAKAIGRSHGEETAISKRTVEKTDDGRVLEKTSGELIVEDEAG
jgi:hypothetical protein